MQETDRIMEEMYAVLEQHQTVGWLELVMNHKDFSQTVENIFTLSFLVSGQSWPSVVLSQHCHIRIRPNHQTSSAPFCLE